MVANPLLMLSEPNISKQMNMGKNKLAGPKSSEICQDIALPLSSTSLVPQQMRECACINQRAISLYACRNVLDPGTRWAWPGLHTERGRTGCNVEREVEMWNPFLMRDAAIRRGKVRRKRGELWKVYDLNVGGNLVTHKSVVILVTHWCYVSTVLTSFVLLTPLKKVFDVNKVYRSINFTSEARPRSYDQSTSESILFQAIKEDRGRDSRASVRWRRNRDYNAQFINEIFGVE